MKNIELLQKAIALTQEQEVKELIKRFMLSNETLSTKFNPFSFCADKKKYHEAFRGIYFSGGYMYATNGMIAYRAKEAYNQDFEDKIMDSTYNPIYATFPNIMGITPDDKKLTWIEVDFKKVIEIEKMYNNDKRLKEVASGYVLFNDVALSVPLLSKIAKFALFYGITQIGISDKEHCVKAGMGLDTYAIIMPMMPDFTSKEVREYKLN